MCVCVCVCVCVCAEQQAYLCSILSEGSSYWECLVTLTQMLVEEVSFSWAAGCSLDTGWLSAGTSMDKGRREEEREKGREAYHSQVENHRKRL